MTVSRPRSARASKLIHRSLAEYVHALGVRRLPACTNRQIFADRAGEKLGVLRDEANLFPQAIDLDLILARPVVVDVP